MCIIVSYCSLERVSGERPKEYGVDEDSETEDETELIEVNNAQEQEWDCESILRCV